MIYIFDNGEVYSNHMLYFVEAPDDFGTWFNEVYRPWVDGAEYRPLMIVGTTEALAWRSRLPYTPRPPEKFDLSLEEDPMREFSTMPATEFLEREDVIQERDGTPRPRYRLETVRS
jgi:hypothetical protein